MAAVLLCECEVRGKGGLRRDVTHLSGKGALNAVYTNLRPTTRLHPCPDWLGNVHARVGGPVGQHDDDRGTGGRPLAELEWQGLDDTGPRRANQQAPDTDLVLRELCLGFAHRRTCLVELFDAGALEHQGELCLRFTPRSVGPIAQRALLVHLGLADELAGHQLERAVVFAGRCVVRALRAFQPRARLQDLVAARPVHQLGQAMARDADGRLQLGLALGGMRAVELQQGLIPGNRFTLVNHDADDRLVGFGRQLQTVALECAEGHLRTRRIPAARERQYRDHAKRETFTHGRSPRWRSRAAARARYGRSAFRSPPRSRRRRARAW